MSTAFARSMRSLESDRFRPTLATLFLATCLLFVWGAWFFLTEIPLYCVTDLARLEVGEEAHPVQAPIAGKVIATSVRLGQLVQRGDLLIELDSAEIRYQLEEKRADKAGLIVQLDSLQEEIQAQSVALGQARQAERSALGEGKARWQEAEAAARVAGDDATRFTRMYQEGLVPQAERERAESEAQQRRAAVQALEDSMKRLTMDRRFEQSEKQALIAGLERKGAEIMSQLAVLESTLARLEYELERHRIRAPVSGRIGEVVLLREGSVLHAGGRVAAVVPAGEVRVVAEFSPPEALGRVRPEQKARLRLDGFPWIQYGAVEARVARVANETHNGKIRVELTLEGSPSVPIPLQHGLPGTLEVEVERVSPADLVLRAVGRTLARPKSDAEPGSPPASSR